MKNFRYITWAAITIMASSCANILDSNDYNIKDIQVNPSVAIPLAFGSLSISDLLSNKDSAFIKVYPDGLVYLAYDQTIASQNIRNLLTLNNINITPTPTLNVPAGTPSGGSVTATQVVSMGLSPEQLNEIAYRSGTVSYTVSVVPANPSLSVNISIPEFTLNTVPFSSPVSGTGTLDMANYIFKSATPTTPNQFTLDLTVTNNSPSPVPSSTTVTVTLSITNMNFTYVKGFLGDQTTPPFTGTLPIQAFGTSFNGATVSFAQPKFNFTVINEFGVPTTVTINTFEARKTGGALAVSLNPVSPITIAAPASLGGTAITNISITNAKPLLDFAPTEFYYDVTAAINSGLVSGNNFMADTSKLKVKLGIEIPLYGQASNVLLRDTLAVNFSNLNQSQVNKAFMKIMVTNEIPLDANMQFYFTDAGFVILDSLLAPTQTNVVPGSKVTPTGELLSAGVYDNYNKNEIELDAVKLGKIFSSKHIIVKFKLQTSRDSNGNPIDVKFMTQYKIDVKLGLLADLKIVQTL